MDYNLFDNWNSIKKDIHFENNKQFYIKEKDIWYINIGYNIWFEENWKWYNYKRPILVYKRIWIMFMWIPMTTHWKENNKFYYKLPDKYFNKKSFLIFSQIKSFDKKRFIVKIWTLSDSDFNEIKKELKKFLF